MLKGLGFNVFVLGEAVARKPSVSKPVADVFGFTFLIDGCPESSSSFSVKARSRLGIGAVHDALWS